ncbi:class I SAM-dependent methyltransferase [Marisediminicola sp. LYQ134]|uniref:class I SAM-dependent methyltransferase n=1 Tax=Marisediminicola sp. LYQ134 TaxID=3391061 RepID=UPI003983AD59
MNTNVSRWTAALPSLKTGPSFSVGQLAVKHLSGVLRWLNERIFFPIRRRYLVNLLTPRLIGKTSVLDLGSSDGGLAASIRDRLASDGHIVEFTGADVRRQPVVRIPTVSYQGDRLPFDDDSFDSVLLIDVLHHTDDPEVVLREAARVSRGSVIVKDHYYENEAQHRRLQRSDYIGNAPYGIRLPYNYLSLDSWTPFLTVQCGMSIRASHRFRFNKLDDCPHILFELGMVRSAPARLIR